MSQQSASTISLDIKDGIAFLTLTQPDAGNTISLEFGREFHAATAAIVAAAPRVVVLSGQGRNFCFGGDLKGMAASALNVETYLRELTKHLHAGIYNLVCLSAPVILAVNGTAAGAGFGLVLAGDMAIAASNAKFVSAYTGVGLTPDAGCTYLLPRAVGHKRATELMLTNRVLTAEDALSWGLINQVVSPDELKEVVGVLAMRLATGPRHAFGSIKRLLGEARSDFEAHLQRESETIARQGSSDEGQQGISAFIEKRIPKFS